MRCFVFAHPALGITTRSKRGIPCSAAKIPCSAAKISLFGAKKSLFESAGILRWAVRFSLYSLGRKWARDGEFEKFAVNSLLPGNVRLRLRGPHRMLTIRPRGAWDILHVLAHAKAGGKRREAPQGLSITALLQI